MTCEAMLLCAVDQQLSLFTGGQQQCCLTRSEGHRSSTPTGTGYGLRPYHVPMLKVSVETMWLKLVNTCM